MMQEHFEEEMEMAIARSAARGFRRETTTVG
jgi:hypothetical protein